MKQHEQAKLLFAKGCQDEALVDQVLASAQVSDEIVGFHCQQAAEKYLKAVLSEMGVAFHRTHNLRQLMDMLSDARHAVPSDLDDLDTLTPFGTTFRYDMLRSRTTLTVPALATWCDGCGCGRNDWWSRTIGCDCRRDGGGRNEFRSSALVSVSNQQGESPCRSWV
jgi:hypothetical protein